MNTMYVESKKQISPHVGCEFGCTYCIPSFQRQLKRRRKSCEKCYTYEPHMHWERLAKAPPRTNDREFIFMCHTGDFSFAQPQEQQAIADWMAKYFDRTFLLHSKDPGCFNDIKFSDNVILGTTMETNRAYLAKEYSKAPSPYHRANRLQKIDHPRKEITIEPILDFDLDGFMRMIRSVNPEFVYIGYDTKNCKLKEPSLLMTKKLIKALKVAYEIEVREKTIRKAWWE